MYVHEYMRTGLMHVRRALSFLSCLHAGPCLIVGLLLIVVPRMLSDLIGDQCLRDLGAIISSTTYPQTLFQLLATYTTDLG